ncbi:hypothetical protein diail_9656 [Diaporthe ilicicola]|nr:hypothetical protein diail_9656 [Diaporthe ilicicola]
MNPYEANPNKIPSTDRYADEPLYGRYFPLPSDFKPDASFIGDTTPDAIEYWASVLKDCTESNRIYENQDGGRDVFALGQVIVKSSHLKEVPEGRRAHRDYSYADANEVKATAIARAVLKDVKVPKIYFASKIHGRDVLVQERIAGVGLNVAWQYISPDQKTSFKEQARKMLQKLKAANQPQDVHHRCYVVPDPDPVDHRGIQELEKDIIFGKDNTNPDLSFMHNDVSLSNCIVDNDKIVGLVDWEMAGFFGWKTAADVHVQIRTPKRANFASLNLPEERLNDVLFWNDLYELE